jgi:hypothetical protein
MNNEKRIKICLIVTRIFFSLLICFTIVKCRNVQNVNDLVAENDNFIQTDQVKSMENGTKWSRCFLNSDGIIFFKDSLMSVDGGKSVVPQKNLNVEEINGAPERAVLSTEKEFYALDGPTEYISPGIYKGKAWRSNDNLKTLQSEEPVFYIPDGIKPRKNVEKWFGIFVYRTILKMDDGKWLMTMYGNFEPDTITPADKDAAEETQFMMRTIIVTSEDKGHSWKYLSTVAVPAEGEPVGEGFVEPAITMLKDGRLLCIMRTGHHFPLYSSWSNDKGMTWTPPVYTGLDRGCDPCLITLYDGRVALSWGRRFPEGWSEISFSGDKGRFEYPGEGYTSLSISNDGGLTWDSHKILEKSGSCYSTIFEVEPGVVFMQADQWYCRIMLSKY